MVEAKKRTLNDLFSIRVIDLIGVSVYFGFSILFMGFAASEFTPGLILSYIFLVPIMAWFIKMGREAEYGRK